VLKTYYQITKPGIIYGNAITTAAGFFLASRGHINVWLGVATLVGVSLVVASACVFNNYIDRHIDRLMSRTKKRALVEGSISGPGAITYAIILGLVGFLVLMKYTNLLTVIVGLVGLFFYVVMYSIWKRRSVHGTLVGSIAGAVPPVAGYCAVTNNLNSGALILFLILVFWQMAHFYAIAIYRVDDYASAKVPVLSVKKGLAATRQQILFYVIAFMVSLSLLTVFGYSGYFYLGGSLALSLYWLFLCLGGFKKDVDLKLWAHKMFLASLMVILGLSVLISIGGLAP